MRAFLSRRVLSCLERRTPQWVRSLELQILLNLAAESFGQEKKYIWRLPPEEALSAYAAYTVACMESTKADPGRLYQSAFRLGRRLRFVCGLREEKDLQRLVFYLYRNIRIDMRGSLPGELLIPCCFFSRRYTPAQCAVMSNADAGVIAGLYGGGSLRFTARLTEGCSHCRACFKKEGDRP